MFIFSELQCSRRGWINTSRSSLGASLVNFCLERENKRARESTLKDRDRGQCSRAPHYNPSPLTPTSTSLLGRNFQSISEETHHKITVTTRTKIIKRHHTSTVMCRGSTICQISRERTSIASRTATVAYSFHGSKFCGENNKTIIVSQWYTVANIKTLTRNCYTVKGE